MENKDEELKQYFAKFHTAYYLSQAILEDYANHISKVEGTTAEDVKKRVNDLAKIKFEDSKK